LGRLVGGGKWKKGERKERGREGKGKLAFV